MQKVSPKALGMAAGILWAAYVFLIGLFAISGWGASLVNGLGTFYIGYAPSFPGAVIGMIWGFIDGFVAGFVIGWLYNKFTK